MKSEHWIVIATDVERPRLARSAEKLRRSYPGKYDIRITQEDLKATYALAVRHRDQEDA